MKTVLPVLIDHAGRARDRLGAAARQAAQALQQARTVLAQLQGFRAESLQRAPGSGGQPTSTDAMAAWQAFMARLDDAIALQQHACCEREAQHARAQQQLAQAQRRLMAFQALARRREAEDTRRELRRLQREWDEFAARAHRQPDTATP